MKLPFGLTPTEIHAFEIGFAEGATFFKRCRPMPEAYDNPLESEWHYYTMGRPIGVYVSTFVLIVGIILSLKLGGVI